jgi:hypothetical protein
MYILRGQKASRKFWEMAKFIAYRQGILEKSWAQTDGQPRAGKGR